MPCSDGGQSEYQSRIDSENRAKELESMKEMLCSACRALTGFNFDFDLNPQLSRWWDSHKKEDEKRRLKEVRAKLELEEAMNIANTVPIGQLTQEQRKLLKKHGIL